VAHSKLQSLLAQLEKAGSKSFSPPQKCQLNVKKEIIKTQVLSSSPANFSFLVGSMPNPESNMSSIARFQVYETFFFFIAEAPTIYARVFVSSTLYHASQMFASKGFESIKGKALLYSQTVDKTEKT